MESDKKTTKKDDRPGFFAHVSEMKDTAINWLIKKFLEQDCLAELFGESGSFKTFLAIAIGMCVATAKPFYGNDTKDSGAVFFIIGEGQAGFRRRLKAWCIKNNYDLDKLPVFVSRRPAEMTMKASVEMIQRNINGMVEKYGIPRLIIIDTLDRNFGPGDENSTPDMATFRRGCDALRIMYGTTILVIHHSGYSEKDRGRGNSNFPAALDYVYQCQLNQDGSISLFNKKAKDQPLSFPRTFKPETVDLGIFDEDGDPVNSCVLDEIDFHSDSGKDRTGKGNKQTLMREILEQMVKDSDAALVNLGKKPEGRIPEAVWIEQCKKANCSRSDICKNKKLFFIEKGFVHSKIYA